MLASGECTMESPLYVDSSAVCGHADPSSKMSRPGSPSVQRSERSTHGPGPLVSENIREGFIRKFAW